MRRKNMRIETFRHVRLAKGLKIYMNSGSGFGEPIKYYCSLAPSPTISPGALGITYYYELSFCQGLIFNISPALLVTAGALVVATCEQISTALKSVNRKKSWTESHGVAHAAGGRSQPHQSGGRAVRFEGEQAQRRSLASAGWVGRG